MTKHQGKVKAVGQNYYQTPIDINFTYEEFIKMLNDFTETGLFNKFSDCCCDVFIFDNKIHLIEVNMFGL